MKRKLLVAGALAVAVALAFEMTSEEQGAPALDAAAAPELALRMDFSLVARAGAASDPAAGQRASLRSGKPSDSLRLRASSEVSVPSIPAAAAFPATAPDAASREDADSRVNAPVTAPAPAIAPQKYAPGTVRIDLLARVRDLGDGPNDSEAFGAKSWLVVPPPPPPPPPQPPEVPRAPPLPFRYMGQINDGMGKTTYFLLRGTATLSVAVGETIDSTYLLESANGGALQFTFLPLKERQNMIIGVTP